MLRETKTQSPTEKITEDIENLFRSGFGIGEEAEQEARKTAVDRMGTNETEVKELSAYFSGPSGEKFTILLTPKNWDLLMEAAEKSKDVVIVDKEVSVIITSTNGYITLYRGPGAPQMALRLVDLALEGI
jgi:hypothetical protein